MTQRIAEVRGIPEGTDAISPSRFADWHHLDDYKRFAEDLREFTDGIPIGVKMSAQHVEADIDAALAIGVDYIILDGRGGGTGAARPSYAIIFRYLPYQLWLEPDAIWINAAQRMSASSSLVAYGPRLIMPRPLHWVLTPLPSVMQQFRLSAVSVCGHVIQITVP